MLKVRILRDKPVGEISDRPLSKSKEGLGLITKAEISQPKKPIASAE
jgi:hypothetical protein